jgi:hypothetical protein
MKLLTLALLLGSAPALAGETAKGTTEKPDQKICVKQEVTGSRLARKRVCKTAAEWAEERKEAREMLEHGHRHQTNPTG